MASAERLKPKGNIFLQLGLKPIPTNDRCPRPEGRGNLNSKRRSFDTDSHAGPLCFCSLTRAFVYLALAYRVWDPSPLANPYFQPRRNSSHANVQTLPVRLTILFVPNKADSHFEKS